MPQRRRPLFVIWKDNDNHISKQIYRELELYAKDKGFYPTQMGLFKIMSEGVWVSASVYQEARYPDLRHGVFDHWFQRLVDEKYIMIDMRTRAIKATALIITDKEQRPPELE